MSCRGTLASMAGKKRKHRGTSPDTTKERDPGAVAVRSELGGYRLLRTIGRGEHSVAYLASGDDGQVVVKAYADDVDAARIDNEVACLTAVASSHVVSVIDVSCAPDRPVCIVLERLSGPTLADWLRDRILLDTGEVVTAAVSVVRGIRAVHAAGWAHGNVAAASIRFDESGCPVLLGFGSVTPVTPARVAEDWDRCATIMDAIVTRAETVEAHEVEGVRVAMDRLRVEGAAEGAIVDEVERALFALGPPAPLTMGTGARAMTARSYNDTALSGGAVVHDETAQRSREDLPQHPRDTTDERAERGRRAAGRAIGTLAAAMEHGVARMISGRLRRLLSGRRRPVLIGAGGAVALTLVALLALPSTQAGHAEAPTPALTAPEAGHARSSSIPSPRHPMSTATPPTDSQAAEPEDDPVHAAFRLLRSRGSCLEEGDDGCLSDVDQADSPLFAADRALIAGGQRGQAAPELDQLSLTETIGDAAVVSVAPAGETTKPASILLIRTEAGWRLRALFES